jgi:K+-transporting ATPase KdpF subunit
MALARCSHTALLTRCEFVFSAAGLCAISGADHNSQGAAGVSRWVATEGAFLCSLTFVAMRRPVYIGVGPVKLASPVCFDRCAKRRFAAVRFLNAQLTLAAVACTALVRRSLSGRYLCCRSHLAVCANALAGAGAVPPRWRAMSVIYVVSGLLALGLCVYLLYAMFKPENF